jgi:hypothetical protein
MRATRRDGDTTRRRSRAVAVMLAVSLAPAVTGTGIDTFAAPSVPRSASDPGGAAFVALEPCRLADTRTGLDVVETPTDRPGRRWRIGVAGRCGIPDGAVALAVSVAATDAPNAGYVTLFAAGAAVPPVSSLNHDAGRTRNNGAVVAIGADGIDAVSTGAADVVVDVTGAFVDVDRLPGSSGGAVREGRLVTIDAERVLDTRDLGAAVAPGGTIEFTVPASLGATDDDVRAVVANVTVVGATSGGWVRAWPSGDAEPGTASVVVDRPREVRGVTALVAAGRGAGWSAEPRRVSLRWSGPGVAHLVVDVFGGFTGPAATPGTDGLFVVIDPARVLDTRVGVPSAPGGTVEVSGEPVVPSDAAAVAVNTTMVSLASGWMRVGPAGLAPATPVATVNGGSPGATVTGNLAVVALSTRGMAVFSSATAHAIVDVAGWFTGTRRTAGPPPAVAAAPPPGPSPYPAGRCDTIVAGLPPLSLDDREGLRPATLTIGTSVEGRPIVAEYWGPDDPVAVVIAIGQIHGNECAPLLFVDEVRRRPTSRVGVWLIPTLNPDGHARYSRANANGVDLNKDGLIRGQPETQALLAFTALVRPAMTIHVHSPNGQLGWYGTAPYRTNDPIGSGAVRSNAVASIVSARTGLVVDGAGIRRNEWWFLWQGQRAVWPGGESLLVELHAVAPNEVVFARPRPPHRSVDEVRAQARAVLDAVDLVLGGP